MRWFLIWFNHPEGAERLSAAIFRIIERIIRQQGWSKAEDTKGSAGCFGSLFFKWQWYELVAGEEIGWK